MDEISPATLARVTGAVDVRALARAEWQTFRGLPRHWQVGLSGLALVKLAVVAGGATWLVNKLQKSSCERHDSHG